MSKTPFLLLFLAFLPIFLAYPGIVIEKNDGENLEKLAKNWPSNPLKRWDPDAVLSGCYWEGIECNLNGSLISIDFNVNQNLGWEIPEFIGNFLHLKRLNISTGWKRPLTIPSTLGKLTELEYLLISDPLTTSPYGVTPLTDLSGASNLKEIHLRNLKLNTTVAGWIPQLKKLEILDLSGNSINGSVDYAAIAAMPALKSMDISPANVNCPGPQDPQFLQRIYDGLEAKIDSRCKPLTLPPEVQFLKDIYGAFGRCIPNAPNSNELNYACDTGLKSTVECQSNRITKFKLVGNGKSCNGGEVPKSIQALGKLQSFSLEGLTLVGQLPSLVNLSIANFTLINIKSNQSEPLPSSFCQLGKLQNLVINRSSFKSVPDCIFGNWNLDLSNNGLSGPLPLSMCNATLPSLNISGNDFTGEMLTTCDVNGPFVQGIVSLDASNNRRLSGNLPTPSIFSSLVFMDLTNCSFYGELTNVFPGGLTVWRVGGNRFNGTVGDLLASDFLIEFDVRDNKGLSGPLPLHFGLISGLLEFRISGTNLTCPNNSTDWFSKWDTIFKDCHYPPYVPPSSTTEVKPSKTINPVPDVKHYPKEDGWLVWVIVGSIVEAVFVLVFVALIVLAVLIRQNRISPNKYIKV